MKKISLYNGWKAGEKVRFHEEVDETRQKEDERSVEIKQDNIVRKITTEEHYG